jgi:hypothetical protein
MEPTEKGKTPGGKMERGGKRIRGGRPQLIRGDRGEGHVPFFRSDLGEDPIVGAEFLELLPTPLGDGTYFTSPAVMDKALVSPLNRAWCELFGAENRDDRSRVVSAICAYFAVNSTTPRVLAKERLSVVIGGVLVDVNVEDIQRLIYQITKEVELRRVFRAYADFTRAVLVQNPVLRPHLFTKFNLPDNFRHIAFDCSEYCESPPLSQVELDVLRRCRAVVLERTAESDRTLQTESEENQQHQGQTRQ